MKNTILYKRSLIAGFVALAALLAFHSCEVADDLLGSVEDLEKLEGTWSVDEESEYYKSTASAMSVYTVSITVDPDNTSGVIIDNFYGVGISVRANVSGRSIIIPNQNTDDDYTVYGSGTINSSYSTISFDYVVDDNSGGAPDNVTAEFTKVD